VHHLFLFSQGCLPPETAGSLPPFCFYVPPREGHRSISPCTFYLPITTDLRQVFQLTQEYKLEDEMQGLTVNEKENSPHYRQHLAENIGMKKIKYN